MSDITLPEMPKIDLSATMLDLLDQLHALEQYVENGKAARSRIKDIERTLAYLNSVSSMPVTIPQRRINHNAPGKTQKKGQQPRGVGSRTKRVNVLWKWNERQQVYTCMVRGCTWARENSSAMGSHFQRAHPEEYEANSLNV